MRSLIVEFPGSLGMSSGFQKDQLCARSLPENIRAGLTLLKQAYDYARDLDRDVWEFAVEIRALREAGLISSDLRWLTWKGYVEHGDETTELGMDRRQFSWHRTPTFSKQTCFVLTAEGAELASDLVDWPFPAQVEENGFEDRRRANSPANPHHRDRVPVWDPDRHQLRLGGRIVKEFKLNSPNQEAVLTAFEEEGWPPRIDDPLVPRPESEPRERLRNTIKSLNRKQIHRLIRFMGDGTGEAIRWELTSEDALGGSGSEGA